MTQTPATSPRTFSTTPSAKPKSRRPMLPSARPHDTISRSAMPVPAKGTSIPGWSIQSGLGQIGKKRQQTRPSSSVERPHAPVPYPIYPAQAKNKYPPQTHLSLDSILQSTTGSWASGTCSCPHMLSCPTTSEAKCPSATPAILQTIPMHPTLCATLPSSGTAPRPPPPPPPTTATPRNARRTGTMYTPDTLPATGTPRPVARTPGGPLSKAPLRKLCPVPSHPSFCLFPASFPFNESVERFRRHTGQQPCQKSMQWAQGR